MPIHHFLFIFVLFSVCIFTARSFTTHTNNTISLYKSITALTIVLFIFILCGFLLFLNLNQHQISILEYFKTEKPIYIAASIIIVLFVLVLLFHCYRIHTLLSNGQEIYLKAHIIIPSYKRIDTSDCTSDIDIELYGHNPYTGKEIKIKTLIKHSIEFQHKVISPIKNDDLVPVYIKKENEKIYLVDLRDFYKWPK